MSKIPFIGRRNAAEVKKEPRGIGLATQNSGLFNEGKIGDGDKASKIR
jgi:hypothetical protein